MSVLIKGMEMPESCEQCPFLFVNELVGENVCVLCARLSEDCPLVPAADVRENVRGEWERVEGFTGVEAFGFKETTVEGWSCSICDFEIDVSEKSFNYCPNCGADMRGAKQ